VVADAQVGVARRGWSLDFLQLDNGGPSSICCARMGLSAPS
jgi:hypothetical protein